MRWCSWGNRGAIRSLSRTGENGWDWGPSTWCSTSVVGSQRDMRTPPTTYGGASRQQSPLDKEIAMKLSQAQIQEYDRNGFLFFPGLLSKTEMSVISQELDSIVAKPRREIVYEKDGKTLRSIFNMHAYNEGFARMVRHPK